MTPSAAAGSGGAPRGRYWGLGDAGVHHSVRRVFQGVPAPHWMQTHLPPAPQARKNPSSSSSGVWLPPGTGRSPRHSALPRFGYLLRGCFRTAWTGPGDNGAAPAPNPALFGPRKIPVFLPQEPLGWGGGRGGNHSSSDDLPSWGRGCRAPVDHSRAGAGLSQRGSSRELAVKGLWGK